ncbi:Uncharacterized protein FWK35_00004569 [Aphis craccivora]|uniref:Uncharacterized protein n=1 Tax=Aphis craccivora TaxID=307492 RepID=A0A6G0ZNZ6_APHCR|nr:Uncharacterized protein FWK35_00004569 [Aphis craccivora]
MPCSAVTLSLATITAIVATALLAIAFSTDNWVYYEVRRNQIQIVQAGKQVEKFQLLEMKVFQLPIALRTEVDNLTDCHVK